MPERHFVLKAFIMKLRKRHIIETLAAFIAGGWLFLEFVDRILVAHYELNKKWLDVSFITLLGALLCIILWRWFSSTEKRPGNVKVEVLIVPLIILVALAIDLNLVLQIAGIPGKKLLIGIVAFLLGIAWIIFKSLQWAAGLPEAAIKKFDISKLAEIKPEKSIVVLPFKNISPEEGQDYFSEGLTEELITRLSKILSLRVISRTSAFMFKDTSKNVKDIAQELSVGHVLEGSVRKAGNKLRITAQLINAATDTHIWADTYDGILDDVFDVQEKVSRSIVDTLRLKLTPDEKQRIAERPIGSPLAYEYYLKARQGILQFTEESLNRALQYLQDGLAVVDENALLLAGMGYVYYQYVNLGMSYDETYIRKAEQYAKRVFELDPDSPYGHLVLGLLTIWWKDTSEGIRHLKRVLAVNPYDFDALYWLSWVYATIGKKEAAEPLIERLMKIDPLNPSVHLFPGVIQWWDGQFDSALRSFQKSYQAFPADFVTRIGYIMALILNNRYKEAWIILGQVAKEMPGYPLVELWLKFQYAQEGKKSDVLQWKSPEFKNWAWRDFSLSYYIAECYSLVAEKKDALDWLEHSIDLGMINYLFMNEHDPFLANIRSEPRFKKLMERVKYEWEHFEV